LQDFPITCPFFGAINSHRFARDDFVRLLARDTASGEVSSGFVRSLALRRQNEGFVRSLATYRLALIGCRGFVRSLVRSQSIGWSGWSSQGVGKALFVRSLRSADQSQGFTEVIARRRSRLRQLLAMLALQPMPSQCCFCACCWCLAEATAWHQQSICNTWAGEACLHCGGAAGGVVHASVNALGYALPSLCLADADDADDALPCRC